MLPLLHFSPSLVTVVHFGLVTTQLRLFRDETLAVPPPHFDAPGSHKVTALVRSELPTTNLTDFAALRSRCLDSPFLDSSGLWAILWFVRNPSGYSRKLTLFERRILSSVSRVTNDDVLRRTIIPSLSGLPLSNHCQRFARHFLRDLPLRLTALAVGHGPCLSMVDKLTAFLRDGKRPCALNPRHTCRL